MAQLFNTTSFRLLEQGINVLNRQQTIIAQNIANQDTPNYKCKYLYFGGVLKDKLDAVENSKYTKQLEIASAVYVDENTKDQPDGNNVDTDTQSALFAKNGIMYEELINQMNSEFNLMRTAMKRS